MMEQKEKILVVDDQIFVADSITSMLDWRGYQCQMVYQAFDALNLLARESFDLVLTDINMPGKTGIELLHDIMKSWPDTAVVLMTAMGKTQDAGGQGISDGRCSEASSCSPSRPSPHG